MAKSLSSSRSAAAARSGTRSGPRPPPPGSADLSFVEPAYTAIPYLSWAEVVLGDPLMRLRLAPDAGPLDAGDSDPVATAEEEAHADESASGDPDDFQP